MDAEVNQTGLAVMLPPSAAAQVLALRQSVELDGDFLDPHITLAYPPFVPYGHWGAVRNQFLRLLAGVPAYPVELNEVCTFTAVSNVVWLKPEDGGATRRLRDLLEATFPAFVPPPGELGFVPHVTLGVFETQEEMREVEQRVRAVLKPVHFVANEVRLARRITPVLWQFEDSLPLQQ